MAGWLPFLIPLLAFLATFSVVLALITPIRQARLSLPDDGDRRGLRAYPLLWAVILALARFHENAAGGWLRRLERPLMYAGHPLGLRQGGEFLVLVEAAMLAGVLLCLLLTLLLGLLSPAMFIVSLGVGLFSGWAAFIWLFDRVAQRRRQISRQYPYFLDLAVMVMEAGASLLETIDIFCRDNRDAALGEELQGVLSGMRLGKTLGEALTDLRERLSAEEVRTSINALIQGQRMGTPLGELLREQADNLRFRRSQMAERAAEELKVRITGPVVLMMAAVLVLIIGPALIEVSRSSLF